MKSFKEYLTETMLQADEINYAFKKFPDLIHNKKNITAAKKILAEQDVKRDTISAINRAKNKQDYTAFRTKSKKERDAVISVLILMNTPGASINLTNPENFSENVKEFIVTPIRRFALNNNLKSPEPEKGPLVPGVKYQKSTEGTQETPKETPEDKGREELAAAADKSTPSEEPETEEPETEEPETEEPDTKESSANLDVDFPNPMAVAKRIQQIKKEAQKQFEEEMKDKDLSREKVASLERVHNNLLKKLIKYENTARKQSTGYSVRPTPSSKRKASTAAKLALNSAETAAQIAKGKVKRKQLDIGVTRLVKRGKEAFERTGKKIIGVKDTRVAGLAKDTAERAVGRVVQRMDAKTIQKYLGTEKAQEYAKAIGSNNEKEAQNIMNAAIEAKRQKGQEAQAGKIEKDIERRATRIPTADRLAAARKAVLSKTATGAAVAAGAIKKVGQKISGATSALRTRNVKNVPDFTGKTPEEIEAEKRKKA